MCYILQRYQELFLPSTEDNAIREIPSYSAIGTPSTTGGDASIWLAVTSQTDKEDCQGMGIDP